ncbi:hypothetical protein HAX54_032943 [Datura stramonium]|uniref:Uncharacterized protein n=1 Tax=Datura stramonium TaxID=4076 RepID=A0ABS8VET8_DATST|nr:hypothetical protein [Datura stramonium]
MTVVVFEVLTDVGALNFFNEKSKLISLSIWIAVVADLGVAEMEVVVFEVLTDVGALNFFNGDFKVFMGDYRWVLLSTDNDTISKGNIEPDASHPQSVDKSTKNTATQEVLADDKEDVPLKKEKKKKKTEEKSEIVDPIENDNNDLTGETTKKIKRRSPKKRNGATDSKDSKKRKRLTSDENENQGVDSVGTEESKCRKIEGLEELKVVVDQGKSDALCTVTDMRKVAIKNKMAKSLKQTLMVIIRPKTVNAFQRVKIDQVEFKDDRLRDNSYCAKDGADIDYVQRHRRFWARLKEGNFSVFQLSCFYSWYLRRQTTGSNPT